ncbi:unnamed protein product [Anisakis simplex]|uniref:Nucleolar pre-ribosomal-associated protein 1 (inferred by orthology to a human protein) n=2 Tax=Anisakis simplex TaxID=6269 RepID=A0A0M3J1Q7_ANISI|nr:unnamed protein product [Anisakis simplex]
MSFLVLKPTVDIENVPEFYKLFLSSTVQYHHKERQWILTLIADSLIEPYDYNVLQKRYVIKLCLSLFTSNMSTMETRKLVLIILRSALKHQSVAKDLFYRSNLQSWITVTAQQSTLSRWEKVFLCQLFITLYEHIKTFMMNETNQNDIKSKNQIALQQKICQMLSRKMKQMLDEVDDSGRAVWSKKLDDLISSDWSEKEVVENDNA